MYIFNLISKYITKNNIFFSIHLQQNNSNIYILTFNSKYFHTEKSVLIRFSILVLISLKIINIHNNMLSRSL